MNEVTHTGTMPKHFRVLVIDDNEVDREITTRHLGRAWPFERELVPEHAASGEVALEKLRANRFALVVLDWKLPVLTGSEVLRELRRTNPHVPVVVLSGLQRAHISENLESLGAAFLNKDDLTPLTFHAAIAQSLKLLGLTPA